MVADVYIEFISHVQEVPRILATDCIQTSVEISFLGSPKDSIFYSIARFFYQNSIPCCHYYPVANSLKGSK